MKDRRCKFKSAFGPRCCAEEGHQGSHQFLCVSEHQPGESFTVSVQSQTHKKKGSVMKASDLTKRWMDKELNWHAIYAYLRSNILGAEESTTFDKLSHISQGCHAIYEWHMGIIPVLGDFLTALVKNDLWEACMKADDTNRSSLWIYVQFLYNVAPSNWKEKIKESL